MNQEYQQYVRVRLKNLTKKQYAYLENIVQYFEKETKDLGLEELEKERVKLQKVLTPTFDQIIHDLILQDQRVEEIRNLKKIKIFFEKHIDSYERLEETFQEETSKVRNLLQNKKYLEKLLDWDIYTKLLGRVEEMQKRYLEQQKMISRVKAFDNYLSIYLSSRYNFDEIQIIANLTEAQLDKAYASDFINRYYSKEIIDQVKEKNQECSIIKEHRKRKNVIIKNASVLKIVKPYITNVSQYNLKNLNIMVEFLSSFGSVEEMILNNADIPSYNYVLTCVKDQNTRDLLNDKYSKILESMIIAERLFREEIKIPDRKRLVEKAVSTYYTYNGSILVALENTEIPKFVFLRALKDAFVKSMYGEETYQIIQDSITAYKDKQAVLGELQKIKTL